MACRQLRQNPGSALIWFRRAIAGGVVWRDIRTCGYKYHLISRIIGGLLVLTRPFSIPHPFSIFPGTSWNLVTNFSLMVTDVCPHTTSALTGGKFVISNETTSRSREACSAVFPGINRGEMPIARGRKEDRNCIRYKGGSTTDFGAADEFWFGKKMAMLESSATPGSALGSALLYAFIGCDGEIVKRAGKLRFPISSGFGAKRNLTSAVIECTGHLPLSKFATLVTVSKSCFCAFARAVLVSLPCFSSDKFLFRNISITSALWMDTISIPKSSIARPTIKKIVDTLASFSFADSHLEMIFPKSATYSPQHAAITITVPKYSTNSQETTDPMSQEINIILLRAKRQRICMGITILVLLSFAVMRSISTKK